MRQLRARNLEPHGLGPGRQQQPIEFERAPVGERQPPRLRVEAVGDDAEPQVDPILGIETLRPQRQPFLRRAAGEIVLREIGAIERRRVLGAQHDELAREPQAPQFRRGREARRAAADDHHRFRGLRGGGGAGFRRAFAAHENLAVPTFDRPAGKGVERGGAQDFPRGEVEARVVPGTMDLPAQDESVDERRVVMRAMRADRENLVFAQHQQHFFVPRPGRPICHRARVRRSRRLG